MKTIKKGKINSVVRFDRQDFLNNKDDINNLMFDVLVNKEKQYNSTEIAKSKEYLDELNIDIIAKEYLQVRLYMILDYQSNTPICFALFSQDETRDDWHLEFISTKDEFRCMGYAEALLLASAKDIANTEFPYISSVVSEDNYASLALHESVGDTEGIKLQSCKMDDEDELYDSYMDDQTEYDDYSSEQKGYANRISFLFDVKGLRDIKNIDIVDDIVM